MIEDKIQEFLQEVQSGRGCISLENAKLLWKILFDLDLKNDEKQELLKLVDKNGNKIVTEHSLYSLAYLNEDDFFIEFETLYDNQKLILVVDSEGIVKIARRPKSSSDPLYTEHADYVYKHTLPKRLLKSILTCSGKLSENLGILRLFPEELREIFAEFNCKDFELIVTEIFKRPFIKKHYYIVFHRGEKISIEKSFDENLPWDLIETCLNRDVNSFIYEISSNTLTNAKSFSAIITNEKYLLSKYTFALTYNDFLFIFSKVLSSETLNYLERVWKGEIDKARQIDGPTSAYDESNGQTYYSEHYLEWRENY